MAGVPSSRCGQAAAGGDQQRAGGHREDDGDADVDRVLGDREQRVADADVAGRPVVVGGAAAGRVGAGHVVADRATDSVQVVGAGHAVVPGLRRRARRVARPAGPAGPGASAAGRRRGRHRRARTPAPGSRRRARRGSRAARTPPRWRRSSTMRKRSVVVMPRASHRGRTQPRRPHGVSVFVDNRPRRSGASPRARRSLAHAAEHLEGLDLVRPGVDPGPPVLRDRGEGHLLPPGPPRGRRPDPLQAGLLGRRRGGPLQRHRQGLRAARRRDGRARRRRLRQPADLRPRGRSRCSASCRPSRSTPCRWASPTTATPPATPSPTSCCATPSRTPSGSPIVKVALRQRERLAVLRPREGVLVHADPAVAGRGAGRQARLPRRGRDRPPAGADDGRVLHLGAVRPTSTRASSPTTTARRSRRSSRPRSPAARS